MSDKQKIISDIYNDPSGFGSKATTLKDARQKDKSITMDDVNQFFRKNVEVKKLPRGQNSFVAPHHAYQYQLDLFFIGKEDFPNKQKTRIGLVLIDIFSKYAVVLPIASRTPPDLLAGILEGIQRMGQNPKMIYSDEESNLIGDRVDIRGALKDRGIELHTTRDHPNFAERYIRSFKDALFKRVEADEKKGKQNIDWTDYIFQIMITYNNKNIHSSTQMTPKEARLRRNEYAVKLNLELRALKNRTYPELNVGDEVKVMKKKAITEKERSSRYLADTFKVTRIEEKLGQKYYYLEGRPRPHLRYELLKV